MVLLGQRHNQPALLIVEKRAFDTAQPGDVYDFQQLEAAFDEVQGLGQNDAYHWMLASLKGRSGVWPAESYKISMISPATDTVRYLLNVFRLRKRRRVADVERCSYDGPCSTSENIRLKA